MAPPRNRKIKNDPTVQPPHEYLNEQDRQASMKAAREGVKRVGDTAQKFFAPRSNIFQLFYFINN